MAKHHHILYVEEMDFYPDLPQGGQHITLLDVEISIEMAREIIKQLSDRINKEETIGAIRFRLSGRMVLP